MGIKAWFLSFLGELGSFLKALFVRGVASEVERLLPIALEVVKMLGDEQLSGEEKRTRAAWIIRTRVANLQWTVAADIINLAIEMAVQKWKAEQQGM